MKRLELTDKVFSNIFVLEYVEEKNTHAVWKCLCMCCNSLMYITSSSIANSTKNNKDMSCRSCAQKQTTYKQECEILQKYKKGVKRTKLAKEYKVGRTTIYRIIKDDVLNLKGKR